MKREKAYVDARRKSILELLRENPTVRVDELAKRMGVSLITIRRDLQYLEEQKLLVRFYGGAQVADRETAEKNEVQMYRKLIARYAAGLVEDGDLSSSIKPQRIADAGLYPVSQCDCDHEQWKSNRQRIL